MQEYRYMSFFIFDFPLAFLSVFAHMILSQKLNGRNTYPNVFICAYTLQILILEFEILIS